jgi:hypothetical protein
MAGSAVFSGRLQPLSTGHRRPKPPFGRPGTGPSVWVLALEISDYPHRPELRKLLKLRNSSISRKLKRDCSS